MTIANPAGHAECECLLPDDDAIETVAFLARSEHRIHVLSLLSDGGRRRAAIREAVDATRVTLSRILNDLQERTLVAQRSSGDAYELTQYGELVYRDLKQLLDTAAFERVGSTGGDRRGVDGSDSDRCCPGITGSLSRDVEDHLSVARRVANRDDAIETVAFLARSKHRIHVLSLLSDGGRPRDEIAEELDATRVTLSRILGDLEDRELIARQLPGNSYELTRYGGSVSRDFRRLLGTVSVGQVDAAVLDRLPVDWLDFDLRCLTTAELVTGNGDDPMSAARAVASSVRHSSTRLALLGTFLSLPFHTFEDALRNGDEPDGAVVFDANVTQTIADDPTLSEQWRKIEAMAERTVYYSIDQQIPCGIAVHDDETAFLTIDRKADNGFYVLRSTHPDVVEWANRTITDWRAEAIPLRSCIDG
ncbi:helix-turn-helix transcriptional regulator [Halosimplex sp. J119]